MKWRKIYELGKDLAELTKQDFERFNIWVDCLELEDQYGETFCAPIEPQIAIPSDATDKFYVKASFILADGTYLEGVVDIWCDKAERSLEGINIFVNDELIPILAPPQFGWEKYGYQYLCQLLNKKPEEVFPIYFRCPVGFEDEKGVIEGEYLMDFRADKGIKLSSKGKEKSGK